MRHAGVMLPLFSCPSSRSWGLGELPDLDPLAAWLAGAGFDRLLILPTGVVAGGDTSPYSAISAMAIDPMYIALADVPEFVRAGGEAALTPHAREHLAAARASASVRYENIRAAKGEALAIAFDRFVRDEWSELTLRASELAGYIARERWWLEDFALYAAIVQSTGAPGWRDWPAGLRDRDPAAIDEVRRQLWRDVLRQQYLQWLAETQWQQGKHEAHAHGVTIIGDFPFMVSANGPDVWVRPGEFMLDVSLGVPPDAFSATGQDWGMPTYRWDRIWPTDFAWIRQRVRRFAALYDGCRVDHLVGLYRTYGRPPAGDPFFNPADEPAQIAQGEAILRIMIESGATVIAEDLGVVPDFVRASLERLGVPGCKVLRWERRWNAPGQPFIDPRDYPVNSAAMTGTHDTETLAGWWAGADAGERRAFLSLLPNAGDAPPDASVSDSWGDALRDAALSAMYGAASRELFLPMQDLFGWVDRINVPATIGDHNWTWRLPWKVDELRQAAEAVDRQAFCRAAAAASGRALR